MNPVKAALRHPQVIYVLTALMCLAGFKALMDMPRREDPKIAIRRGLVLAAYPGATAEQVEEQVTRRIEERLFGFSEVRKAKTVSTSMVGGVVIDVTLEDAIVDADRFWSKLRHDLNELGVTELPQGVLGPIVNSDFGDVIAVLLSVSGERYGYRELQDYLEVLEAELLTLPEVSKVKRIGEQEEKIYVTSTMEQLVQYGITPLHLVGALQQQNVVAPAGAIDAASTRAPIQARGLYVDEDQIRRQMAGMGPGGAPIYVGDIAQVERRYADPDFFVRANGHPSVMLTLEMREGHNIVDFGRRIDETVERVRQRLPPDLVVEAVVDQPKLVAERIGHFLQEFGLALLAVIAATMILLPLPVATVAATAIPVTVAMTFAVLQGLGIELHQVSLAALIVVLGMVVDDAIVIADNYVELLDQGLSREEAAWRSSSDLAVPVFTATLTIAAAFLPLAFLPGQMGEFMFSLPVTVALALANSYIVAMLLTPLLCRTFIKKGLHSEPDPDEVAKPRKRGALDLMQALYDRVIALAMVRKRATMAFGVVVVAAGLALAGVVDQRFFPPAERDEFAINVWMPEGTRLDATDGVVRELEAFLSADPDVVAHASFTGVGGPRFFFSFEPALPRPNVGQIIVRTTSVEATPEVVRRVRETMPARVPAAELDVQRLTQGDPMWAPVEVRLAGADLATLRSLGDRVSKILEDTPGSLLVRNDFREDSYAMEIGLRPEVSNRLGMSTTTVSNLLAGTFLGLPVSTFWEGDDAVDIVLRLDESRRDSFEDLGGTYVVSSMARVPLRSIADLRPVWQPSRIVHRNGIRTLTVGSFAQEGVLASEVLAAAEPALESLVLPAGYELSYGGEVEIQSESFGHLSVGMLVSVLCIFLILLFQFQSVKDSLVVMVSIPLALFGAYFGLLITSNPFGFTAFMGLISLTGVVVRNAIILLDYIREKRAEGVGLEAAALEAGRRRLRPIFLTTISAAAGLTPMILSGSGLWSPLASVIAVGLVFSMVFTLVIVPVLYVLVTREREVGATAPAPTLAAAAAPAALLLCALLATPVSAQEPPVELTLERAVELARDGNAQLSVVRREVEAARSRSSVAFTTYLPRVRTQVNYLANNNTQGILLPEGSLGYFSELGGKFPRTDRTVPQGGSDIFFALTTVVQPLTHFFKIREGRGVLRAEEDAAGAGLRRAEQEVELGVLRAYSGLLIAQVGVEAARERVVAAEARQAYLVEQVTSGIVASIAGQEARVGWLQARQALLEREDEVDDLTYALVDAVGLAAGTRVRLAPPTPWEVPRRPLEDYTRTALRSNPELMEARALSQKATHGVGAARAEYIPEIGILGGHLYQSSFPFLPRNTLGIGVSGSWTLLDFGARRRTVQERQTQLGQAEANLRVVQGRILGEVEAAYRRLVRAEELLALAGEAMALSSEAARLSVVAVEAGYAVPAQEHEAAADRMEAEMDLLRARLGHRIAVAELARAAGTLGR